VGVSSVFMVADVGARCARMGVSEADGILSSRCVLALAPISGVAAHSLEIATLHKLWFGI
jgi:hypothetical protein